MPVLKIQLQAKYSKKYFKYLVFKIPPCTVHIYIDIYFMYVCIQSVYIHTHTHARTHTCVHTHTHAQTHTNTLLLL